MTASAKSRFPPHEAGGWRVEDEFISAIRGQEEITHTDFATGVKYMEFTEAVYRSRQQRGRGEPAAAVKAAALRTPHNWPLVTGH